MLASDYYCTTYCTEVKSAAGHLLTSNVGICCRLQRSKAIANDENAGAKSLKRFGLERRYSQKSTKSIQAQSPDEDSSVAIVSKNPCSVADGGEWISSEETKVRIAHVYVKEKGLVSGRGEYESHEDVPKIGCLKTCRPCSVDFKDILEVLVECIKKTVAEAPEEEQKRHQEDGIHRSTQRQFGSSGSAPVVSPERVLLEKPLEGHGSLGPLKGLCGVRSRILGYGDDADIRGETKRERGIQGSPSHTSATMCYCRRTNMPDKVPCEWCNLTDDVGGVCPRLEDHHEAIPSKKLWPGNLSLDQTVPDPDQAPQSIVDPSRLGTQIGRRAPG